MNDYYNIHIQLNIITNSSVPENTVTLLRSMFKQNFPRQISSKIHFYLRKIARPCPNKISVK